MQLTEREQKIITRLEELIYKGEISRDGMVQIIELCFLYSDLKPISKMAKQKGKTYNGILKTHKAIKINGKKYV